MSDSWEDTGLMGLLIITQSINTNFPLFLLCQSVSEYYNFSLSLRFSSPCRVFTIDLGFVRLLVALERDHQVAIILQSLNCGKDGLGVRQLLFS